MPSTDKRVVVVFGATGVQGGSVAQALLQNLVASQQFSVRAITRDPSSPAAAALVKEGAEVVKANLDDKESLRVALKNAYAVYLVTNWAIAMSTTTETTQGKNVADIAKELDVKHLIWSAQPSASKISNNKLNLVAHFESKALVTDYIRSLSIPHTFIYIGVYPSLVVGSLAPISASPPSYGLIFPEPVHAGTKLPIFDPSADLGKFVTGMLLSPEKSLNRSFNVATKYYTLEEVITLVKNFGLDVELQVLDKPTFKGALASKGLPEWLQEDLLQVFQFTEEYGLYGADDDIAETQKLFVTEPLTSFEDSLKNDPEFVKLLNNSLKNEFWPGQVVSK